MSPKNIVVIGAGVAGLTTALVLSQKNKDGVDKYNIVVAAKHMPGDYDIEYASPWAGANFVPTDSDSRCSEREAGFHKKTWERLAELAEKDKGCGIHLQDCELHIRIKDKNSSTANFWKGNWFKESVKDLHPLREAKQTQAMDSGKVFKSVGINPAIYLPWLVSECLKQKVTFKRAFFENISSASSARVHPAGDVDLVVNCTGLGASRLGGIEDEAPLVPDRGQFVVVRNQPKKMITMSGTAKGPEESCYVMTRPAGGGTILGGSHQKGNWDSQPDPNLSLRIMQRALKYCPSLVGKNGGIEDLEVIGYGVGLRPHREGGVRIEKVKRDKTWVVHNYGSGNSGYQTSYGCAEAVVELIEDAFAPPAQS